MEDRFLENNWTCSEIVVEYKTNNQPTKETIRIWTKEKDDDNGTT